MNVYLTNVRSGIAHRVWRMRMRAAGALACALTVLVAAAPAQAKPQAVIAFLPPGPGETRPLLEEFAARGMAIGMTSPTVGGFKVRQMGLDMSQGTRIPTRLYSKRIGALVVRGVRVVGWDVARRRAQKAPGDLVPGLLASTIERAGGHVGYSVGQHGFSIAPIVAANEAGGVRLLRDGDSLGVIELAPGAAGRRRTAPFLAGGCPGPLLHARWAAHRASYRDYPTRHAARRGRA